MPWARIVVTTAGRFSGSAPIANATAAGKHDGELGAPLAQVQRHRDQQGGTGDPKDLPGKPGQWRCRFVLRGEQPGDLTTSAHSIPVTTNSPDPRVTWYSCRPFRAVAQRWSPAVPGRLLWRRAGFPR